MKSRNFVGFTLLLSCFIFLTGIAFGQSEGAKKVFAEIIDQGSGVAWSVSAPHKMLTLSVSTPDGEVYVSEFEAGSNPVFSLVSNQGKSFGDGLFKYQIVVTPNLSPEALKEMRAARRDDSSDVVADDLKRRGLLPEPLIQSGSFRVVNGQILTGTQNFVEAEPSSDNLKRDVPESKTERNGESKANVQDVPVDNVTVINMDLVVLGSECIGLDCPNNPSFGFDTLRLQENNLRIDFLDTSNTASFPTNDWKIEINDTTNGGQDRFSVFDVTAGRAPFTIEGGAAVNSLYVDSTSRIGFKTATPVVELHSRDGDTPTLRLEQDGSSGFTAQTWDIAGNEANFFIRDVTNGSRLPFKIRPGAATDSLVIEANGNVSVKSAINYNGGGTSASSPSAAQQFYGGQAILIPGGSSITPAVVLNEFGISTNGQAGFASVLVPVPASLNLANVTASNVVYKIRYRDPDGVGTGSLVSVNLVSNNIVTGARSAQLIFDSNTSGATTTNTVTICQAASNLYFDYASANTHISVVLVGTAALSAEFFQVQVYKINVAC